MTDMVISPIGKMVCKQIYPQQQPRQGFYAENSGHILLNNDIKLQEGLLGLEGFDYIWVVYNFDKNNKWKSLVSPPVKDGSEKIGVFASRSPYRPNQIGISVVKLNKIVDNRIYIENFDLLNDTPVIDIKPYISIYDSIENCRNGWVKDYKEQEFKLYYSDIFLEKSEYVNEKVDYDLKDLSFVQLRFNPVDSAKKRVISLNDNHFIISFRTWRVEFICELEKKNIYVENIYSGYSDSDLLNSEDKYSDKEFHRMFKRTYETGEGSEK